MGSRDRFTPKVIGPAPTLSLQPVDSPSGIALSQQVNSEPDRTALLGPRGTPGVKKGRQSN
jgi:hypothetical protein